MPLHRPLTHPHSPKAYLPPYNAPSPRTLTPPPHCHLTPSHCPLTPPRRPSNLFRGSLTHLRCHEKDILHLLSMYVS